MNAITTDVMINIGICQLIINIDTTIIIIISDALIWHKTDIPIFRFFIHRYLPIPITDPIFYI